MFILLYSYFVYKFQKCYLDEIKSDQNTTNKIHLLSPCSLGDPASKIINYPDSWCSQQEISLSILSGKYDSNIIPIQKEDYLVFSPDGSYLQRNWQRFRHRNSLKLF